MSLQEQAREAVCKWGTELDEPCLTPCYDCERLAGAVLEVVLAAERERVTRIIRERADWWRNDLVYAAPEQVGKEYAAAMLDDLRASVEPAAVNEGAA